jgi:hypothetical protein
MVLALRVCQRRLLLQQVAEQNRLLRVRFLLITQFFSLGVTDCFCDSEVRTRLSKMSKLRIDFDKNLFTGVSEGQSCLLLCKGSLTNLMAFLPPIPGLPCKQGANRAYGLR